jgi:4-hydroxybenzoate polyprenyltransferase
MRASIRKSRKKLRKSSGYDDGMRTKAVALALSTHPGPALAVTVITVVLGIGVGLSPARLVLLAVAMLANQASVGLSNDWIDAERDRAVGRTDKPVALGHISPAAVRNAAWIAAAASVLLSLTLGWAAAAAQFVFIASAWTYNAGLKKTPLSVLPYIVSFGLLPTIVTLSLPTPSLATAWAFGVGALLGVAAHFANVLPDLDDDRATGVSGLPHRLGRRVTSILTYLVLLLAALLEFLGTGGTAFVPGVIGLAVNVIISVIGTVIAARPTRWHFRFIIAAALVDVAVLAFAGSRVLGH